MVVQNISLDGKETDLTFTIKSEDVKKTEKIIKENKKISYRKLSFGKNLAKISIIGVGMITAPGITYRMFQSISFQKDKHNGNFDFRNKNFSFNIIKIYKKSCSCFA